MSTVTLTKSKLKLSDEQQETFNAICDWVKDEETDNLTFITTGYAGTGKTTVIKAVVDKLGRNYTIRACAYTGKAASVLRSKGVYASTIHRLIYEFVETGDGGYFVRKDPCDLDADLIIVDETSMINETMYADLLTFGVKLWFVGDSAQLPPVSGNKSNFDLLANPDSSLEHIHRQAAKSGVLRFSNHIRQQGHYNYFESAEKDVIVMPSENGRLVEDLLLDHDQTITYTNNHRHHLNSVMRQKLGYEDRLVEGDKIVCMINDNQQGVFNGLMAIVKKILSKKQTHYVCHLELLDMDETLYHVKVSDRGFGYAGSKNSLYEQPQTRNERRSGVTFWDYGYCLTCHSAQGSEWDSVLVSYPQWARPSFVPPVPGEHTCMTRWTYTACTRAAKHLTLCQDGLND